MVAKPSTTERKVMKPRAERAPLNIRHLEESGRERERREGGKEEGRRRGGRGREEEGREKEGREEEGGKGEGRAAMCVCVCC